MGFGYGPGRGAASVLAIRTIEKPLSHSLLGEIRREHHGGHGLRREHNREAKGPGDYTTSDAVVRR